MLSDDSHYYLLQAFNHLGRHLFGDEWTGQEFQAPPATDPREITTKIEPLAPRQAELEQEMKTLTEAKGRTTDADEIARLNSELARLTDERNAVANLGYKLEQDLRSAQGDWPPFDRHTRTLETLLSAFRSKLIRADTPNGVGIEWADWEQAGGFVCYLALSLVCAPRLRSSVRRFSVIVRKDGFAEWIKSVTPINEKALAETPPEQRCRAWLPGFMAAQTFPVPKPDVRAEAQKRFPGLSKRAFDRVWSDTAPEHRRRGGRPKASKNHRTPSK